MLKVFLILVSVCLLPSISFAQTITITVLPGAPAPTTRYIREAPPEVRYVREAPSEVRYIREEPTEVRYVRQGPDVPVLYGAPIIYGAPIPVTTVYGNTPMYALPSAGTYRSGVFGSTDVYSNGTRVTYGAFGRIRYIKP